MRSHLFASDILTHFILKHFFRTLLFFFTSDHRGLQRKSTQSLNNCKKKQPLSLAKLSAPTFLEAGEDLRCGFLLTREGLLDISQRCTALASHPPSQRLVLEKRSLAPGDIYQTHPYIPALPHLNERISAVLTWSEHSWFSQSRGLLWHGDRSGEVDQREMEDKEWRSPLDGFVCRKKKYK